MQANHTQNHSRGSAWVGTCDLNPCLMGGESHYSGKIAETYKISVASGGIKPGKPLYRQISVSLGVCTRTRSLQADFCQQGFMQVSSTWDQKGIAWGGSMLHPLIMHGLDERNFKIEPTKKPGLDLWGGYWRTDLSPYAMRLEPSQHTVQHSHTSGRTTSMSKSGDRVPSPESRTDCEAIRSFGAGGSTPIKQG